MNSLENAVGSYHFSPEGLKLVSKCPVCSEQYQPFQASIVEEKDEAQLVHIQCRKCASAIVALIVNGQMGLTSVGVITDLSSNDVERFKDAPSITEQDLFTAFQELKKDPKKFLDKLQEEI
jgi:hypothetical protein